MEKLEIIKSWYLNEALSDDEAQQISEQELLEIILWTLKISRIKITHPAKLCIVIYPDKIEKINLHKIKYLFG